MAGGRPTDTTAQIQSTVNNLGFNQVSTSSTFNFLSGNTSGSGGGTGVGGGGRGSSTTPSPPLNNELLFGQRFIFTIYLFLFLKSKNFLT